MISKYKELRIFLIKEFIFTLIVVSIVETALLGIFNKTIIPIVLYEFFGGASLEYVSIAALLFAFLIMAGSIILELINMVIPSQFKMALTGVVEWLAKIIDSGMYRNRAQERNANLLSDLSTSQQLFLFLILLVMFLFIIAPIILGAYSFARVCIKEFEKLSQAELEKQKDYERKRNLMLSDIAHDLRTPITTVSGYSKALADGMVKAEKQQEYLEAIQNKSKRMSDLINLLFDYVKLDSDGFVLNKTEVDVCELVRECVALQYQDIEDAKMELDIDIPEKVYKVKADKIQLARVVTNLITNAIKHNNAGTKLGVFVTDEEDRLRIMVADTGDKIDETYAEHIFDPFVMGDESRNSRGGSGLGLSIASKIIEMHGFRLKLIQKPDIKSFDEVRHYEKMFMITIVL